MHTIEVGIPEEELRERVIEQTVTRLLEGDLSAKIASAINEAVDKKLKAAMDETMAPFVEQGIEAMVMQETNRWGEAVGKAVTFREYIVQRCEAYLHEPVNFEGKNKVESRDSYSFKGTQTRLTHMVHEHLHYRIDSALKAAIATANGHIAKGLEETVRIKLAEISSGLKVKVETGR